VELGAGRFILARLLFAVKLSLLPNRTDHDGPPPCEIQKLNQFK